MFDDLFSMAVKSRCFSVNSGDLIGIGSNKSVELFSGSVNSAQLSGIRAGSMHMTIINYDNYRELPTITG